MSRFRQLLETPAIRDRIQRLTAYATGSGLGPLLLRSVTGTGIVRVAALVISRTHHSPLAAALLLGAPMIPLLTLARVRAGALQGLQFIVRGQIPETLIRPVLLSALIFGVVAAGVRFTPGVAMALNSASAAVVLLLAHVWLKRRMPPRSAEIARHGRRWLASSIPIGLTDGMRILQMELSVLLLGLIAAPAEAGLFRIAAVTSFAAAMPVALINHVAFSVIARLYAEKNIGQLQRALTRLAQAQFAGVMALCIPLLVAPEFLLSLVFGQQYGPAANTLRILALAQMVTSAFGLNAALLNMTHHERRVSRAMMFALGLNLLLMPILALRWGKIGGAIALAAALILWNVLTWVDARRLLGLETSVVRFASAGDAVRQG